MFRRLQNILCCVVIAGFAAVCWYGKNNGEAVMTGGAVKTTMDKPVVVIDPGHGGIDGGCVSVDGTPEKGINLAVAESLRDGLKLLGYDDLNRCPNTEMTDLLNRLKNNFIRKYYLFENPDNENSVLEEANQQHYEIIRLFREKKTSELEQYIRDVHWDSSKAKFDSLPSHQT